MRAQLRLFRDKRKVETLYSLVSSQHPRRSLQVRRAEAHKIFTQQLQELESYNVIKRTEYDEKPKRVEYSLTEEGRLLIPAILYMRDWGVFANHDCLPDAIKRSHGELGDSVIKYSYDSEALGKSVSIEFQYAKPENGSVPSDGDENV